MNWTVARALALLCLAALASASPSPLDQQLDDVDPRFFIWNTSQYSISLESLVGSALALLALLFLLGGLGTLLAFLGLGGGGGGETGYGDTGQSGYSGSSQGDSYSSYSARSLVTEDLWSSLQTIDWIALAEQLYRADDLVSRPCQQQLICELKRSAPAWGETARAASDAVDYISYMKMMRLPDDVHQLLDQYDEAAKVGRNSVTPCDEKYHCGVSVRNVLQHLQISNS